MPRIPFDELPGHGRLWVFPVSRRLEGPERDRCLDVVDGFLERWAAHGHPLRSARELRDGQFLLVGVDVDAEAPSGCSIDALMGQLRDHGVEAGATFIDHAPVWYRDGDAVRTVSRAEFRSLAQAGRVGPGTRVFDTSLTRVDQVREGALERPASETWHARAFFRDRTPA